MREEPSNPVPSLQAELGKRRPFEHPEQEVHLNLVRTESVLRGDFDRLFDAHGLSGSSYNILRILRGALGAVGGSLGAGRGVSLEGYKHGKPCHEIGEQMVARVPDVTRLVDRLEKLGLVERSRSIEDRRVVYVAITEAGLELLERLDGPVLELHRAQLGHLSRRDLEELSRLLTLARAGCSREEGARGKPGGNPGAGGVVNRGSRSRHSSKESLPVGLDLVGSNPVETKAGTKARTPARARPRRPGSAGSR